MSSRRTLSLLVATAAIGWSVASAASAPARSEVVIGAAGDIACPADPNGSAPPDSCQYDDTSDLIFRTGLTAVLALGDNQYDTGALSAYQRYFDPWWGRVLPKIHPVPGNHEYAQDPSAKPRGYFRYFGDAVKGPDDLGYYSFDVPEGCTPGQGVCWHVIALSSQLCFAIGGCGPPADPSNPGTGNRMYEWLSADLASHTNGTYPCTLAFWHHPRFSFSTGSGATSAVAPLWDLLYAAKADVVLNGHSHNYQRWRPQTPDGAADPGRGIREFIVGTGGVSKYALQSGPWPHNLLAAQADSFGILRLSLRPAGYGWEWVTAAGQPAFSDTKTRSASCV